MLKKTKIVSVALLIVGLSCGSAFAADYQSMTNEELAANRGSMREASQEDRTAFQSEWQSRVDNMSAEDRAQAVGRPEGAARDGAGNQNRNRSQDRQMNQSGDSGSYGTGAGGAQGMGGGGGRGRR